jgi:hypothetical protein
MTAPGLQAFLDGTTPHPKTQRKLEAWLVRVEGASGADTGIDTAEAALRVLLRDLPPSRQATVVSRAVGLLEALYDEERAPRPVWLAELRANLDTSTE